MNDDEDVKHQVADAEDVWVVGARLSAVEEFKHSRESQQTIEPELWSVDACVDVNQIRGQDGHQVQFELQRTEVAVSKLGVVLYQQALFQEP